VSSQNWQNDLELYVLGAVFLASLVEWYALLHLKPSIYIPWIFFGLAFFHIGLPSVHPVLHGAHAPLSSAAAFAFFGLNFGEEAGAATEVWILRACIVQSTQQIWVTGLWYWGNKLKGAQPDNITEAGIRHISFVPGSVDGIRQVVNITTSNPHFPTILQ